MCLQTAREGLEEPIAGGCWAGEQGSCNTQRCVADELTPPGPLDAEAGARGPCRVPAPRAAVDVPACVLSTECSHEPTKAQGTAHTWGVCPTQRRWALGRGEGGTPQVQLVHRLNPRAGPWLACPLREARRGRPCLASPFPSRQGTLAVRGTRLAVLPEAASPDSPAPPPTALEPL